MAPTTTTKAATTKTKAPSKKEKIFHPNSRKADQLNRKHVRKAKLGNQASNRVKRKSSRADLYGFFYHALPEEGELTLDDLHDIVCDAWLTRYDAEIEEEQAARRKGRPKSVKQQKLEDLKLRESEEYRTGMEVLDLTHPENVALLRKWDQIETAYIQMLRFIRINSVNRDVVIVSRPGKHHDLVPTKEHPAGPRGLNDTAMDVEPASPASSPAPLLLEPASRFSSTIMSMDGPA
ncbi:hypothetical protein PENSPDRAFT_584551 [Peniophora sp. CONT]|nr:hypothetical protein PENSPDRAFT_584551 [Peniophora sp. CONT]